ncbi:tetratricopeptide repeat protein (macronuclear) [Tetrahymena thermophila SB210]|uniref:Tetratricopeptide repeat protein n=1 Tax=Tetrahymena thermophila (strain SB210) TaxID=312017 RepID=Q22BR1_TETTS|nr:tetratricopeptide repeat protein [Tetrahymena thermophila SB210]EAR82728.2 tetratricopeptide repeat protein [Tetrahymena thermophila SB210]|eukprot:XP_001030391.2 tetratricopeptide repeat protein [Tetrahymena thermophila SB210]
MQENDLDIQGFRDYVFSHKFQTEQTIMMEYEEGKLKNLMLDPDQIKAVSEKKQILDSLDDPNLKIIDANETQLGEMFECFDLKTQETYILKIYYNIAEEQFTKELNLNDILRKLRVQVTPGIREENVKKNAILLNYGNCTLEDYDKFRDREFQEEELLYILNSIFSYSYVMKQQDIYHANIHTGNIVLNKFSKSKIDANKYAIFFVNCLGFDSKYCTTFLQQKDQANNFPFQDPDLVFKKIHGIEIDVTDLEKNDIWSAAKMVLQILSRQGNIRNDLGVIQDILNNLKQKNTHNNLIELLEGCFGINQVRYVKLTQVLDHMREKYQRIPELYSDCIVDKENIISEMNEKRVEIYLKSSKLALKIVSKYYDWGLYQRGLEVLEELYTQKSETFNEAYNLDRDFEKNEDLDFDPGQNCIIFLLRFYYCLLLHKLGLQEKSFEVLKEIQQLMKQQPPTVETKEQSLLLALLYCESLAINGIYTCFEQMKKTLSKYEKYFSKENSQIASEFAVKLYEILKFVTKILTQKQWYEEGFFLVYESINFTQNYIKGDFSKLTLDSNYWQASILKLLSGKFEEAEEYIEKSLKLDSQNDLEKKMTLAAIYFKQGKFTESSKIFRSVEEFQRKRMNVEKGVVILFCAISMAIEGSYLGASDFAKRSFKFLKGEDNELPHCMSVLGYIEFFMQNYKQSIQWFDKAVLLFKSRGQNYQMASNLEFVGFVHQQLKNYDSSLCSIKEGFEIKKALIDAGKDLQDDLADQINGWSIINTHLNNLDKCIHYGEEALEVLVQGLQHRRTAIQYEYLSKIYWKHTQKGRAIQSLQKCLATMNLVREKEDDYEISCINYLLSKMYYDVEQYDSALYHICKTVDLMQDLYEKHGKTEQFVQQIKLAVELFTKLKKFKDGQKYLEFLLKVIDHNQQQPNQKKLKVDIPSTLLQISLFYASMGDKKQGLHFARSAYNLHKSLNPKGDFQNKIHILNNLISILMNQGQIGEAELLKMELQTIKKQSLQ